MLKKYYKIKLLKDDITLLIFHTQSQGKTIPLMVHYLHWFAPALTLVQTQRSATVLHKLGSFHKFTKRRLTGACNVLIKILSLVFIIKGQNR